MNAERDPLTQAIEAAIGNVAAAGGPFGAVLVTPHGERFTGVNRVTATNDPTAHAEIQAIRDACAQLGTFTLDGCVLYASCEPCPMCIAACLWARLARVVFAADRHDAARAGFDDSSFHHQLVHGVTDLEVVRADHPARLEPFLAWSRSATRTEY